MKNELIAVFNAIKNSPLRNGQHFISYSAIAKKTNIEYTMVSSMIRMLIVERYLSKENNYNKTGGLATNGYKVLKSLP